VISATWEAGRPCAPRGEGRIASRARLTRRADAAEHVCHFFDEARLLPEESSLLILRPLIRAAMALSSAQVRARDHDRQDRVGSPVWAFQPAG
jgi:hypothetical protein